MSQQLWGPALEAELEYRREIATKSYGRPAGTPWIVRTWRRSRARAATKHEQHARLVAAQTSDAAARLGETLDTITVGTTADAWQQEVSDRGARLQEALEALRPREGVGRHAA